MIDTHAHLSALDDVDEVIERSAQVGVTRILTVGTDLDDCRRALELAERYDGVFAVLGIHPHSAGTATAKALEDLYDANKINKIYTILTNNNVECSQMWVEVYTKDGLKLDLWYGMGD